MPSVELSRLTFQGTNRPRRGCILHPAFVATNTSLPFAGLEHRPTQHGVGAQLVTQAYGRGAELESDQYGMRYMAKAGYDPQGAVALQETFLRLSEGRNQDWLSGLFASHPPSSDRVVANKKTAAKLGAGGNLGVESFKAALRKTRAAKPAYDVYDDGRKALSEKKADEALALVNKALDLFPRAEGKQALVLTWHHALMDARGAELLVRHRIPGVVALLPI